MNHQLALAIQLNDQATWADFCWDSNPLLEQQLKRGFSGEGERLFYLWGGAGSGKTHLLQACCQAYSNFSSIYLPIESFKEWGPESLDNLADQRLIAIDDIDVIAQDKAWEEALFHFYNRVRDNGETLLLISSRKPLFDLNLSLADLQSRLAWGLVIQINELSDESKLKTLVQRARQRGFELPSLVGQFLINRCARNMQDLHQILDYLDKESLAAQRKLTVPFVKSILGL